MIRQYFTIFSSAGDGIRYWCKDLLHVYHNRLETFYLSTPSKMALIYSILYFRSNISLLSRYPDCFAIKLNVVNMVVINEIQKCKNLIHIINKQFGQGKDQVEANIQLVSFYIVNVKRVFRRGFFARCFRNTVRSAAVIKITTHRTIILRRLEGHHFSRTILLMPGITVSSPSMVMERPRRTSRSRISFRFLFKR